MHVQIKKFSSKVSSHNVYRENKMYKQVYWKIKNVQNEMMSLSSACAPQAIAMQIEKENASITG